jgi:hypothetical protein
VADELSTLFGVDEPWVDRAARVPWTDVDAPVIGGPGTSPAWAGRQGGMPGSVDPNATRTPELPPEQRFPVSGNTPADNAPSGRSPRILDRIPDSPPYQGRGYAMPIPAQNIGGAKFTPVGASSMDSEDLDAVTRTILGEVGANASPAEMASIASVIRNRVAVGGFGQTPYDIAHRPMQFSAWNSSS